MDANGVATIIVAVVLSVLGVYKNYGRIMAMIQGTPLPADQLASGNNSTPKDKPTIDNLNERINELEKARTQAEKDRDAAHEETGRIRSEFETRINGLQKQIDDLREQNRTALAETAQAKQERDKANADYLKILEKQNADKETIISMGKELGDLEDKFDTLKIESEANKLAKEMVGQQLREAVRDGFREALATDELQKVILAKLQPQGGA